jgi:hypothetical protein
MQWPQAAVGKEWQVEVQGWPHQLGRDDDADEHTHDAPNHGHYRELAHYLIVI